MNYSKPLFLYEEIVLLALRNEQGTPTTSYVEYVVAGAVLAELLLARRVAVEDNRKQLVDVRDTRPIGDPIIDECFEIIKAAGRRASLQKWVSRLARIKKLGHKVARQLCNRKILHADEKKVLFIFTRKIFPEINPAPEKKILERLRMAIFTETDRLDPHTVVLISLANAAGLLGASFGRKEVRNRRKRIEQIVKGELTGKATKELIAAIEAAVLFAAIMPAIIACASN
jgi:hypothetical protein